MFSQTAEYALRTIVWLAAQEGMPRTTQQIAEATRVPVGYLAKVLQTLGRARLLNSQRGIKGGFTLARPPGEISVLDVINAVDPIRRIERCPLGLASHRDKLCPLHSRLNDAIVLIEEGLSRTKIADLLGLSSSPQPFCD